MPVGQVVYMSLFALGLATYLLSMIEDAFRGWPGWGVLLLGWFQIITIKDDPFVALAWCANPLLFAAWTFSFYGKRRIAIGTAGAALALGVLFLLGHGVLISEGGGTLPPNQHGPGYDFWLASLAIAFAATLVPAAKERDQKSR